MRIRRKGLWLACLLALIQTVALAQSEGQGNIPDDVFYLMPSFGEGMVYIRGQIPAQGQLNICAVDNTLRFKDKSGQELVAKDVDNILKVTIDGVDFIRDNGAFLRLYPAAGAVGLALKREVTFLRDVKAGAYGTTSQTTSVTEYSSVISDGLVYELNKSKEYPYRVYETVFLYQNGEVMPLNKRSLKKCFPEKKAFIDEYFKSHKSAPDTLTEAQELLTLLAQ